MSNGCITEVKTTQPIKQMRKLKYIVTRYGPIVFDPCLKHADVAHGVDTVITAGFVQVTYNKETNLFVCTPFGNSFSLGKESDAENDKIKLEHLFNSPI